MVPAPTTSTRFNSCMRVSMKEFEDAAQAAVDSIPDEFRPYLENTLFVIEESSPDGLMGLYEGATALAGGEGMPGRITLYKRADEETVGNELLRAREDADIERRVLEDGGSRGSFALEAD